MWITARTRHGEQAADATYLEAVNPIRDFVPIRVIRVLSALGETLNRLARYGELHLFRPFDDFRRLENFESDYPAIVAEVSNDTGANLVAFLHALVAKRDGKRVSFPVLFSLHAGASYFLNFDVL
jgi:hypothetical protein